MTTADHERQGEQDTKGSDSTDTELIKISDRNNAVY